MSDSEILELIQCSFGQCTRPEHFTDFTHCSECGEHDEVLRSRDKDTLDLDDVGNLGWDPICFISPAGFAYYFPALARLALLPGNGRSGWYGLQLINHLSGRQTATRRSYCSASQRLAIAQLLEHLASTRAALIESYNYRKELSQALELWS